MDRWADVSDNDSLSTDGGADLMMADGDMATFTEVGVENRDPTQMVEGHNTPREGHVASTMDPNGNLTIANVAVMQGMTSNTAAVSKVVREAHSRESFHSSCGTKTVNEGRVEVVFDDIVTNDIGGALTEVGKRPTGQLACRGKVVVGQPSHVNLEDVVTAVVGNRIQVARSVTFSPRVTHSRKGAR
ncbi:hypothetical protein NE237_026433 [Protea cynaroides]|uniref:Uncharacterized protein n=1 Tax=Protea cynaroides TaxID=273540 RepID=A0A9Q0H887_9MAGN|nr:hypothetical protein NE237_026433 [Protea cynaroides]